MYGNFTSNCCDELGLALALGKMIQCSPFYFSVSVLSNSAPFGHIHKQKRDDGKCHPP